MSLTRADLAAMPPEQVAALDPAAVQAALRDEAPSPDGLTRADLAAMPPEQVAALDPAAVQAALARSPAPPPIVTDPGPGGGGVRGTDPREGLLDVVAIKQMTPQEITAYPDPELLRRSLTTRNPLADLD
jgi:hypothetical protein